MKFVERDMGDAAEASSGGGDSGLIKEIVTLGVLTAVSLVVIVFLVVWGTGILVSKLSDQGENSIEKNEVERVIVAEPEKE